ncbi:MAG TPA: type II toxin-antitoxin system PemK/MazF family toxin [Ktedonobacterales bacterium]|jgi:mRNA-degrading endonuclease toxin of MazEF toxin-antitoxin module|nr:type II toxin-antitoxin system PemK/MazF family toxin [Ktedonobacterales bacterium]
MPHPDLAPGEATYRRPVEFGCLYWVNFAYPELPAGVEERRILDWHPALAISNNAFCKYAGALNMLPLTTYRDKLRPYHHLLLKADYPQLDGDSLVKTELIYPVLRSVLPDQHFICRLRGDDLRAILGKLATVLNIASYDDLRGGI